MRQRLELIKKQEADRAERERQAFGLIQVKERVPTVQQPFNISERRASRADVGGAQARQESAQMKDVVEALLRAEV